MRTLIAILSFFLAVSCQQKDNQSFHSNDTTILKDGIANKKIALFGDSIPSSLLCQPIATVHEMFSSIKDSVFESEGVEWPVKIVKLEDGNSIVFETSWEDKARIWRMSTNSPKVKFATPYRVGDSVGKIKADGYRFTFNEGDGGEYYFFADERLKNVGFLVEDKYSSAFYKDAFTGKHDPMQYLNSKAKITELSIGTDCSSKNGDSL